MLKFIRKRRQSLLVVAGVLLMIAFLVPGAIRQMGQERENKTIMKIGHKGISARQMHDLTMEYEALRDLAGPTLYLMGLTEGPEQWILLAELADQSGFIGSKNEGTDALLEELGRTRGELRLRNQYQGMFDSLINNPQFAGFLQRQMEEDVEAVRMLYDRLHNDPKTHLTKEQLDGALAKFRGVMRYIRAYMSAARVSEPRTVLRAERDLQGAMIDYIFIPADRYLAQVPEPDDAALQEFLQTYKDVKPGEGEFGVGYMLPPRAKIEYLVLDFKKISDKVTPDLRELMRRYKVMPTKNRTFDEARPSLEQAIRSETVEKAVTAAQEIVRARVQSATVKFPDDGQFKILPPDWAAKRPTLASMVPDIVANIEKRTRPEPDKPGIRIDPPEVVVKDSTFLTGEELSKLEGIGASEIQRGQQRIPFPRYVLGVKELETLKSSQLGLQTGLPGEEPMRSRDDNAYFVTVLDTRPESTPRTIDEVRERLVTDWKKVQAYKFLAAQEADALRQKAIAEGVTALDPNFNKPVEPGKQQPPPEFKSARVTRSSLSSNDPNVNTDTFRQAVADAAGKLNPLTPAEQLPVVDATIPVRLPQKLGVAIVKIRSLVPLTVESLRGNQNRLAVQYQQEEFRGLKANPFTLDRLRQRLNVQFVGPDADKRNANVKTAG